MTESLRLCSTGARANARGITRPADAYGAGGLARILHCLDVGSRRDRQAIVRCKPLNCACTESALFWSVADAQMRRLVRHPDLITCHHPHSPFWCHQDLMMPSERGHLSRSKSDVCSECKRLMAAGAMAGWVQLSGVIRARHRK